MNTSNDTTPDVRYIRPDRIHLTKTQVRNHAKKTGIPDFAKSLKDNGQLQNIVVTSRADGDWDLHVGQRRLYAAAHIEKNTGEPFPLLCTVIAPVDAARALQIGLAENMDRLPMDPFDEYKAFSRLHAEGQDIDAIATAFRTTPRNVEQRLALGSLPAGIIDAHRKHALRDDELRYLACAPPSRQKEWVKLFRENPEEAPRFVRLRDFVFGANIKVEAALFDVAEYTAPIIGDLFAEDDARTFSDADEFWTLQNAAIDVIVFDLKAKRWTVECLEDAYDFWQYTQTAKKNGGKAFVLVSTRSGEVEVKKGFLPPGNDKRNATAKAAGATGSETTTDARPQISHKLAANVNAYRHRAVQSALLEEPSLALRVHVVSLLLPPETVAWKSSQPIPSLLGDASYAELVTSPDALALIERFKAVCTTLGIDVPDGLDARHTRLPMHALRYIDGAEAILLKRLMTLADEHVHAIIAYLTSEVLAFGTPFVDWLAKSLSLSDVANWTPTENFVSLVNNKDTLGALLADAANDTTKDRVIAMKPAQRRIEALQVFSAAAEKGWRPAWLRFSPECYESGQVPDFVAAASAYREAAEADELTPPTPDDEDDGGGWGESDDDPEDDDPGDDSAA